MHEQELIREIALIKERNERVEIDKAWEVSWTRTALIASITYAITVAWLWSRGERDIFIEALVPAVGYVISTPSIPYIKKLWMNAHKK